jgi:hypothetical protein
MRLERSSRSFRRVWRSWLPGVKKGNEGGERSLSEEVSSLTHTRLPHVIVPNLLVFLTTTVIKLFNAILVASNSHTAPAVKDTIDASHKDKKGKRAGKDNILGRGGKKDDVLTKEGFLGLIKNA